MNRIAVFQRVSKAQYDLDYKSVFDIDPVPEIYENIRLPQRATTGSAGYDFYLPEDLLLKPGEGIRIPTGVRVKMDKTWVLMLFPRSSLGFKFRLQLDNTVGVIDSDYYGAENEGHIQIKLTNDTHDGKCLELKAGTAFAQGIFLPFGITLDDDVQEDRKGGFGSTDNKN